MNNNLKKFKTDLNCQGCVSKIQNALDSSPQIHSWSVDTTHPDKILTVNSEDITPEQIQEILKSKGFTAELID